MNPLKDLLTSSFVTGRQSGLETTPRRCSLATGLGPAEPLGLIPARSEPRRRSRSHSSGLRFSLRLWRCVNQFVAYCVGAAEQPFQVIRSRNDCSI